MPPDAGPHAVSRPGERGGRCGPAIGQTAGVLVAAVAEVSGRVAATRSRAAKTALLAELLASGPPEEAAIAVRLLVASPRQGRIGIGWSLLAKVTPAPAATATLTVAELDDALTALAATAGSGSAGARAALLDALLGRATAAEQQLIRGVLLGELRQGALEGMLVEAIAAAAGVSGDLARRAAMLTGDLGETTLLALRGGAPALEAVHLEVLRPVQPMLAATAGSVTEALASIGGPASVEHKLDGARIQVHRSGDEVRIYTRSLAEVTGRLAEVAGIVRGFPARSLVLDGESLALDADGRPRAFQETMSRFGADAPRQQALRPTFFDVLEVDGRDLLGAPLADRLAELQRIVGPYRVEGVVTDDPAVGEQVLVDALAVGHEGVVVKDLSSAYAAGRRGSAWQKVKPVRTLDLAVLAAEWGHGRRTGSLSNLHLGALDPDGRYGEAGAFVMVGKTFKGLTDALLAWQTAELQRREVRRDRGHGVGPPGARRRDRPRRRPGVVPLPWRGRPALRPGRPLPRRQGAGGCRHDRGRALGPAGRRRLSRRRAGARRPPGGGASSGRPRAAAAASPCRA